jgi:hypothetical protein
MCPTQFQTDFIFLDLPDEEILIYVIVVPKYLNFSTFSKDLLDILGQLLLI